MTIHPDQWLKPAGSGLYCEPGGFHIDPGHAVDRAIVTHGHSDHARPGHRRVLATPGTLAIMRNRYGEDFAEVMQALEYGERVRVGDVTVWLAPAGHVLGSAQVVLEYGGMRAVVSGDYKRRFDPTCTPFQVVPCDIFVTEATFGLPVFVHPPDGEEIGKLLRSLALFPESSHVVGVYALGKCQRVIAMLRRAGYDAPIYLHGALTELCDFYETQGVELGDLRPAAAKGESLKGRIVLAPPSAIADRWSRRLAEPVTAMASGWMRVRARSRQRGAELPLIISDHADWPELTRTLTEVGAGEIWVTHGREEALMHYATQQGLRARALALIGREEEGQ